MMDREWTIGGIENRSTPTLALVGVGIIRSQVSRQSLLLSIFSISKFNVSLLLMYDIFFKYLWEGRPVRR
jgi:hypothetical protein